MKTLCLASLLAASFTASAQPRPPTPPGPPTGVPHPLRLACTDDGGVLFEIDHKVDAGSPEMIALPTSELKLYAGGQWTFTSSDKHHNASGCLAPALQQRIRDDLKTATWTQKVADAACAAVSIGYTQYSAHGKVVWTERMCQLEYLDEDSRRSLDDIEKILTSQLPKPPPCCKK